MAAPTGPLPQQRRGAGACLFPLALGVIAFCLALAAILGALVFLPVGGGPSILAGVVATVVPENPIAGVLKTRTDATATAQAAATTTAESDPERPTSTATPRRDPTPSATPDGAIAVATPQPGETPQTGPEGGDGVPGRTVTISTPPGIPVACRVTGNGVDTPFDLPGGGSVTLLLAPGAYTFACSSRVGIVGIAIPVFTIIVPETGPIGVPAVALPFLFFAVT